MSTVPTDPAILLSFINTKLRDFYPDLAELCKAEGCDADDIKRRLSAIGYAYDAAANRFV